MDPAPDDILHQFLVHRDGCTGGCVLVVYEKAKDCMAAVAGLHRSAPGGSGKKGAKGDDQGLLWARQLSGEGLHLKKWRVIVRNLPFSISEEALRNSMDQGGFVWDLTLPTGPEGVATFALAPWLTSNLLVPLSLSAVCCSIRQVEGFRLRYIHLQGPRRGGHQESEWNGRCPYLNPCKGDQGRRQWIHFEDRERGWTCIFMGQKPVEDGLWERIRT